jgi:sugar phosphate permease
MLPFVFLLYVVAYIDRVNVSFATLKMSADLDFGDRVYGLGVGIFYLGYILLEIPGAIIAERWSPRKWIARIMITWGAVTVLTGFIQTTPQSVLPLQAHCWGFIGTALRGGAGCLCSKEFLPFSWESSLRST